MPEWWEGTFEQRMARRAARRAAELAAIPEWLRDGPEDVEARRLAILKRHQKQLGKRVAKPPEKRKRTRPSDGQESGAAFDYEEYLTRLEDRKAADPEEWQRQQRAKREESRKFWDRYKERHDMDRANEAMAEDRIAPSRLHEIWNAVIIDQMNQDWLRNAPLHKQIKAAPRIRGCGAAAKRAGFAG